MPNIHEEAADDNDNEAADPWYWDNKWTDACFAVEALVVTPVVVLTCTSLWFLLAGLRFIWHGCRVPACVPVVTCQSNNRAVVDACPSLRRRLHFPWWMWSGSAVNMVFSIVGRFGLPDEHVSFRRFVLRRRTSDDQPCVEVDVREACSPPQCPTESSSCEFRSSQTHPVIVFSPGFGSNSYSRYAETFARRAHELGYTIVVSNARGAAVHPPSQLDVPTTYTFGDWADYAYAVRWVADRYPNACKVFAVGYSMGGSTVMQALARADPSLSTVVDAAVCCCQGYDVEFGAQEIMRRPLYNWLLCVKIRRLYRQAQLRRLLRKYPGDPARIGQCLRHCYTLKSWDTNWSAPSRGFKDVWEFWRWCGKASTCTKGIQVPMLCVNAADDPMVPERLHGLGKKLAIDNDNIIHVLTKFGSHLGFYKPGALGGASAPPNVTWLEDMVFEFLSAHRQQPMTWSK